jgi:UDP-hydrolysing UDP-N-acetyl-D-glucosamine 2-epimerase
MQEPSMASRRATKNGAGESSGRRRRRICVLTGTRAEYGILTTLMSAIAADRRLQLDVVVTGMHLMKSMGHTVDEIRDAGWPIGAEIPIYSQRDTREDLGHALGTLTSELSAYLVKSGCDILVVLGDRVEVLGGASAAMMAGVPIAHLHGGELAPGELDDRIRFAVSSMAQWHFVSTQQARRRLIRTGQQPKTVHVVGAMGLDEIFALRRQWRHERRSAVLSAAGFDPSKPTLIVAHHPCGFGADIERRQMHDLLRVVAEHQGLILAPNSDPGYTGIVEAIQEFSAGRNVQRRWRVVPSLLRREYLKLLWATRLLVGNSSSGIMEANALGAVAVNIGPRQHGRQKNGNAVLDCGYGRDAIAKTVAKAITLNDKKSAKVSSSFGRGDCGRRVAAALATVTIDRSALIKRYS